MAKRRSAMTVYRAPAFSSPRAPAPIIRIAAPRLVTSGGKRRKKGHGKRSAAAGSGKQAVINGAIGGAAIGFAEKSGLLDKVPSLPMLGAKGSFAAISYFMGGTKKPGLLRDATIAAATLAGYQMGKEGKISGDED